MIKNNHQILKTRIFSGLKTIKSNINEFTNNFDGMTKNADTREINLTFLTFIKEDLDELIANYKTLSKILKNEGK